ncbi:MAG: HAD family hydrolase [Gammaproteobacteria bacterium]|nr:HAD family hydrolase [Gammaproteobacteria bacterium]
MIKAVFFDVGNTLFFYNYDFLRGLLEERYQFDVSNEELEATHKIIARSFGRMLKEGLTHTQIVYEAYTSWFRALGIRDDRIDHIIQTINSHPFKHLFWAKMGEGTIETLNWFLDRDYKLGVISNAEGQIERLIRHAGIEDCFEIILDSHDVGYHKPDERIFKKALKKLKVSPQEAVHVGDLIEADVLGARAAGIEPILIDHDNRYPDVDCLRVNKLQELKDLPIFNQE